MLRCLWIPGRFFWIQGFAWSCFGGGVLYVCADFVGVSGRLVLRVCVWSGLFLVQFYQRRHDIRGGIDTLMSCLSVHLIHAIRRAIYLPTPSITFAPIIDRRHVDHQEGNRPCPQTAHQMGSVFYGPCRQHQRHTRMAYRRLDHHLTTKPSRHPAIVRRSS